MEYLTFGPALHRRRCQFLSRTISHHNVLILGDGDGRFTAEFLHRNRTALVDSIECSQSMSLLAKGRIDQLPQESTRVRQFCEDIRTTQLTRSYDLVITHFFLDCFTTEELEEIARRITAHVKPGGSWLLSEFQIPSRGFRRSLAKLVVKALYVSFGILTGLKTRELPDYQRVLANNRYLRTDSRTGLGGLLVSELWELAP